MGRGVGAMRRAIACDPTSGRGWHVRGPHPPPPTCRPLPALQSMMASPYVRPFADEVRAWEHRLSLISEAIEVRGAEAAGSLAAQQAAVRRCRPQLRARWVQGPRAARHSSAHLWGSHRRG